MSATSLATRSSSSRSSSSIWKSKRSSISSTPTWNPRYRHGSTRTSLKSQGLCRKMSCMRHPSNKCSAKRKHSSVNIRVMKDAFSTTATAIASISRANSLTSDVYRKTHCSWHTSTCGMYSPWKSVVASLTNRSRTRSRSYPWNFKARSIEVSMTRGTKLSSASNYWSEGSNSLVSWFSRSLSSKSRSNASRAISLTYTSITHISYSSSLKQRNPPKYRLRMGSHNSMIIIKNM